MSCVQKAWVILRQGIPSKALEFKKDWPVSKQLQSGEVLVRVQAAAFNPVGWKLMKWVPNIFAKVPRIAEHDLAGEIVDANDTEFSKGDQVFGFISADLNQATRQGALAEYARIPADHLAIRPPNVSPVGAAECLCQWWKPAVGAFAIQIAKAAGARVVATASAKNEESVRKMGADEFIDYTKVVLPQHLSQNAPSPKCHFIFDAVGLVNPSIYIRSEAYLVPNGVFISSGPLPQSPADIWNLFRTFGAIVTPRWLGGTKRDYHAVLVKHKKSNLQELRRLMAAGSLKPIVDSVYGFEDVLKAYDHVMSRRAVGKVVVKVDPTVD